MTESQGYFVIGMLGFIAGILLHISSLIAVLK